MKKRKKEGILFVVFACVGLALILSSLFLFAKQDQQKKYVNKERGFSIKYPIEWTVKELKETIIFLPTLEDENDISKESINIVVQDLSVLPMPKELEKYTEEAIKQMKGVFERSMKVLESAPVRLAGQQGYKFVFVIKQEQINIKYMSLWTIKGNKAYQVTYATPKDTYDKYLSIVEKMIKSFRIL